MAPSSRAPAPPLLTSLSPSALQSYQERYPAILSQYSEQKRSRSPAKPAEPNSTLPDTLATLDRWYRSDLPSLVHSRPPAEGSDDQRGGMNPEEVERLVRWKMAREKFRPTLLSLVRSNDARSIRTATASAFQTLSSLPSPPLPSAPVPWPTIQTALRRLTALRGIGPATASAILAAMAPHYAVFQSDELVQALGLGPPKYTPGFYREVWMAVWRLHGERRDEVGGTGTGMGMKMEAWETVAWAVVREWEMDGVRSKRMGEVGDEGDAEGLRSKRAKVEPEAEGGQGRRNRVGGVQEDRNAKGSGKRVKTQPSASSATRRSTRNAK